MNENENTNDAKAMPPASSGSVAGEPVAWGIQFWGGDLHHEVFGTKEQAEREMHRGSPPGVCTARVVSLHLKPTLTDAEREALEFLANEMIMTVGIKRQAVIRALLERTK